MRFCQVLFFNVLLACLPAAAATDFSARLSSASAAMEYWDVTAWFATGERFSARYLITNQGPGTRTAAAVGHLLLPSGEMVPISYGRASDRWTLSDDRRRLKIASAVLDVSGSAIRVEVDSDKRGIEVRFEIPAVAPVSVDPLPGVYSVDVLLPVRVSGSYLLRGMAAAKAVDGIAALTHTSMETSETEIVVQRAELFGHVGDTAVYANTVTRTGGNQSRIVVRKQNGDLHVSQEPRLRYNDWPKTAADPRYVVAGGWTITDAAMRTDVSLKREYLRWDPLDILPQPFRFLVALQGSPRRVWNDADITLTPTDGGAASKGSGVSVVTFAKPGKQQ